MSLESKVTQALVDVKTGLFVLMERLRSVDMEQIQAFTFDLSGKLSDTVSNHPRARGAIAVCGIFIMVLVFFFTFIYRPRVPPLPDFGQEPSGEESAGMVRFHSHGGPVVTD